jgi:hypothetical protein
MRVLGGQLGWLGGSRTEVAVATARCARSTRHGQWMERKADPGPLAPKAVPGGPAASSTCWCVFMTMRHSAYLFAVVAVRSSCQDHVANDIEPMTPPPPINSPSYRTPYESATSSKSLTAAATSRPVATTNAPALVMGAGSSAQI